MPDTPRSTRRRKLGPGTLTFGSTGEAREFSADCTSVELSVDFDEEEDLDTLDGGVIAGEDEESFAISGTLVQSFDQDSLIRWCKRNSGSVMPFVFTPRNDQDLSAIGSVKIRSIGFGGDVKQTNTSDFEFPGIGDWSFDDGGE